MSTTTFDTLGFPVDFDCQIVAEPPRSGSRAAKVNRDLVVHFRDETGLEWERSWRGISPSYPLTGVYAAPSGRHLFVITEGRGWYVPVDRPDDATGIPGMPLLGVGRVPQRPIVIFWGFQDLVAYGPEGMLWWLDHLSTDSLSVDHIEPDGIHGTVWDPSVRIENHRVIFRVDPWTGEVDAPTLTPGMEPTLRTTPPVQPEVDAKTREEHERFFAAAQELQSRLLTSLEQVGTDSPSDAEQRAQAILQELADRVLPSDDPQ